MKKKTMLAKIGMVILALAFVITLLPDAQIQAKQAKKVTIVKGENQCFTFPKKKIKKIKVKYSKKKIAKVKLKKDKDIGRYIQINGIKTGKTTITVKIYTSKKKYQTKKYRVTVKDRKTKSMVKMPKKDQPAFPRTVTVSLTSDGYVKIQWTKVSGAHAYVVQRKSGNGDWEQIKVTASCRYTDTEVEEYTSYSYRVRANRGSAGTTAFSSGVSIKTGEIKKSSPPSPTVTDDNEKYSYSLQVLNGKKYPLYNGFLVLIYIQTDNPDVFSLDLYSKTGNTIKEDIMEGYDDIKSENGGRYGFSKVNGGYVAGVYCANSGKEEIGIRERLSDYPIRYSKEIISISFELKDYDKALDEWMDRMIAEQTNESMSLVEKIIAVRNYLRVYYYYDTADMNTGIEVNLAQEQAPYFERHFGNCWVCADIMAAFCEKLGIKYYIYSPEENPWHMEVRALIDGKEYELGVGSGHKYVEYEMLI